MLEFFQRGAGGAATIDEMRIDLSEWVLIFPYFGYTYLPSSARVDELVL